MPQASETSPTIFEYPYPVDSGARAWETHLARLRGEPVAKLCPACGDQKFVIDKEGALVACPLCAQGDRQQWLARNCGLEPVERSAMLADWKLPTVGSNQARSDQQRRDARLAMQRAVADRVGLFTFWGDFGSGKSFALRIVANELRTAGIETFYSTLESILGHLRSLYAAGRTSQHRNDPDAFWKRLLDIPVLCLDEVTRFHETDWAQAQLFSLVDLRYRRKATHLTLFATNDDPRQAQSTDNSIGYLFSRMREMSVIRLQGDVRAVDEGHGYD